MKAQFHFEYVAFDSRWKLSELQRVQCETVVDMLGQGIDYRGEMWKNTIWP